MSHGGNGKPITFRVDFLSHVRKEIPILKATALSKGIEQQFATALFVIVQRLRNNPADFGELTHRYRKLELIVHVASVPPLRVEFAYHETKPFVVIKKLSLIEQSPK